MFIHTLRFFSSSSPTANPQESTQDVEPRAARPTQEVSPTTQGNDSDGPDAPSVDTPSPPPSQNTTSPLTASQGLRLFHWSRNSPSTEPVKSTSSLDAQQQFQYKKKTLSSTTNTHMSNEEMSPSCPSSSDVNTDDQDDIPGSPPSQDSAYFSQSQSNLTLNSKTEFTYNFPTFSQEDVASVRLRNFAFSSVDISLVI